MHGYYMHGDDMSADGMRGDDMSISVQGSTPKATSISMIARAS
jgi:hypothetical protein